MLGGNVVIPSFALERAQEVLYYLNLLVTERRIPRIMVSLHSPMAANINNVFERHPDLSDEGMAELVDLNKSPFDMPGLETTRTSDESKAINSIRGSAVKSPARLCVLGGKTPSCHEYFLAG